MQDAPLGRLERKVKDNTFKKNYSGKNRKL